MIARSRLAGSGMGRIHPDFFVSVSLPANRKYGTTTMRAGRARAKSSIASKDGLVMGTKDAIAGRTSGAEERGLTGGEKRHRADCLQHPGTDAPSLSPGCVGQRAPAGRSKVGLAAVMRASHPCRDQGADSLNSPVGSTLRERAFPRFLYLGNGFNAPPRRLRRLLMTRSTRASRSWLFLIQPGSKGNPSR